MSIDRDPGADFATRDTWSWVAEHPLLVATATPTHPQMEAYLMDATRAALGRQGRHFAYGSGSASFLVGLSIGVAGARHFPESGRAGAAWEPPAEPQAGARTLTITAYDAKSRAPIWRGVARRDVTGRDQANARSVIEGIVAKLCAEFPRS